jgi:hypothetical protein
MGKFSHCGVGVGDGGNGFAGNPSGLQAVNPNQREKERAKLEMAAIIFRLAKSVPLESIGVYVRYNGVFANYTGQTRRTLSHHGQKRMFGGITL